MNFLHVTHWGIKMEVERGRSWEGLGVGERKLVRMGGGCVWEPTVAGGV